MENVPFSQIQKGTFMIATPDIDTGMFFRGVILICEHNVNGSFGLVINKKLDLELPHEIINLDNLSNPNISIRAGGPIQTNQMMLLHTSEKVPDQTLQVCDGVYLGGDLEFLQGAITDLEGPNIHLCFGYSGWGAGQLEREFLDGGWYVYPSSKHHIFDIQPDKLWQTLLREMGGKYATLSMIPEDLTLN